MTVSGPPSRASLILGTTRDQAVELGRMFGHRAVVYGEAGGSPQVLAIE